MRQTPPSEPGLLRVLGLFGVDEGQNEVIRVILEDWRAREWTPRVEPIAAAIRRARQALADAEWSGADASAARAHLQTLLAAQARGEQWCVNF
jgi:hypothetical protein